MKDGTELVSSGAALDKVFELATRLSEMMEHALTERGLSTARAEVLFVLHQRGPIVQRELSQALRCTPRHVTGLVDALEAEGWVARSPHPTDRRATLVSLTERGAAAAARMDAEREGAAGALFGDVPADDLATFVTVVDQVLDRIGRPAPTSGVSAPAQPHKRGSGPPETPPGTGSSAPSPAPTTPTAR